MQGLERVGIERRGARDTHMLIDAIQAALAGGLAANFMRVSALPYPTHPLRDD
jgi:hypothetical protein